MLLASEYGVPQNRWRVFIVAHDGRGAFPWPRAQDTVITARDAIRDLENVQRDESIAHVWSGKKRGRKGSQADRTLSFHKPAYTVRSESHGSAPFHYSLPRRVGLRELARFQSFPDAFWLPHIPMQGTERMLGNAVPPVLAWHLARSVAEFLAL